MAWRFIQLALLIGMLLPTFAVNAQTNETADEISSSFIQITEEQAQQYRAILSAPLPEGALSTELEARLRDKKFAAEQLGDNRELMNVFELWNRYAPQSIDLNDYVHALRAAGETDKALRLRMDYAKIKAPNPGRFLSKTNLVGDLIELGRLDDARDALLAVNEEMRQLKTRNWSGWNLVNLTQAEAHSYQYQSVLGRLAGRLEKVDAWSEMAVQLGRQAYQMAKTTPAKTDLLHSDEMFHRGSSMVGELLERCNVHRLLGHSDLANLDIQQALQVTKEVRMLPGPLRALYSSLAELRFDQQEFASAEMYYEKGDAQLAQYGSDAGSLGRLASLANKVRSLEGQRRWKDASDALALLDTRIQDNANLKKRFGMGFERGLLKLGEGSNFQEAADLFDRARMDMERRLFPAHHIDVALLRGLQGVALWRVNTEAARRQSLPMLEQSVADYMRPENFDAGTIGLRKGIRELIFATYLEASFSGSEKKPFDAMASADWIRGGMVQEALADAAIRSAALNPALSDLVRADQDAKREVEALRQFLSQGTGAAEVRLPQIVSKMRLRLDALESSRRELQSDIKGKFPDYEKLVRPTPPTALDLQQSLARDEALVMLLPTDEAVYVWALNYEGKNSALRVVLKKAELTKLVGDMRKTLDLGQMGGVVRDFDAQAASDLYQKLLAPVAASFEGKKHLIVAAGDVLGQFPFGVLLTQPTAKVDASAPWLIKQAAITHVPSLSAWLAVKQFAKAKSAPEALDAWGDPRFGEQAPVMAGDTRDAIAVRHVNFTRSPTVVDLEKEAPRSAIRYSDIPGLPETRDELLAIADILKADIGHDLHLGVQASKASVLESSKSGELQKKKVVAFATHGLMAGDLPHLTQPALALASTGNEDKDPMGALLTLDEVLNLKLNADWVILSACNTAAADGKADEALSGLARGFFYAGSRSLLVTHWAVESESAKLLTTNTMKDYMENPTQRKAESLRQAMLVVMRNPEYAHPAYWAPYALVGDGGR